jgi:hypothetical protein
MATVTFRDARRIFDPKLAVGEASMSGTLVIERGTLADFLHLVMSRNSIRECARKNVAHRCVPRAGNDGLPVAAGKAARCGSHQSDAPDTNPSSAIAKIDL